MGLAGGPPRIHVCQPKGGFPFVRAYYLMLAAIAAHNRLPLDWAYDPAGEPAAEIEKLYIAAGNLAYQFRDVARFAREVGMSRSQLHRKLTALTGLSASAFLRSVRLLRAAELLKGGFGNVTEVAYATGHKSLSHFSRNFREEFGVPPSEYPPEG